MWEVNTRKSGGGLILEGLDVGHLFKVELIAHCIFCRFWCGSFNPGRSGVWPVI